jgi:indole-3-glycerol phosphate synthase
MKFLDTILESKRTEVKSRQRSAPIENLKDSPGFATEPRSFTKSILSCDFGIIAEIKKASPSKGVIRSSFDPVSIAKQYRDGGAAAISVLTDEKFFQGKLEYVTQVREASGLTVLRKDFIIDPYQVYESRAAGADAILLIVAALEFELLTELREEADALGMDVLVEVHTESELDDALESGARLIGVNNRDLQTFHVNLGGALIGSSLMGEADPGAALKNLMAGISGGPR